MLLGFRRPKKKSHHEASSGPPKIKAKQRAKDEGGEPEDEDRVAGVVPMTGRVGGMCAIVCAIACAIVCVRASEYARCAGSTTLAIPSCLYNLPCLPVQPTTLLQH